MKVRKIPHEFEIKSVEDKLFALVFLAFPQSGLHALMRNALLIASCVELRFRNGGLKDSTVNFLRVLHYMLHC